MSAVEEPVHLDGEEWRAGAACNGMNPDVFFPLANDKTDPGVYLEGQLICARCPVTVECLDYALAFGISDGVFGGRNPKERRQLRRSLRLAPPPDLDAYLFPAQPPENPDDHHDH